MSIPISGDRVYNFFMTIYYILDDKIAKLINENKYLSEYGIEFYERNLANGVYFYQIHAGNYSAVKKMLLMK